MPAHPVRPPSPVEIDQHRVESTTSERVKQRTANPERGGSRAGANLLFSRCRCKQNQDRHPSRLSRGRSRPLREDLNRVCCQGKPPLASFQGGAASRHQPGLVTQLQGLGQRSRKTDDGVLKAGGRWRCATWPTFQVHLADELVGGGSPGANCLNSPGWASEVSSPPERVGASLISDRPGSEKGPALVEVDLN